MTPSETATLTAVPTLTAPRDPRVAAYAEHFERRVASLPGEGSVRELRRSAIERFCELGFPTLKMEEWRHTNIAAVVRGDFLPAPEHAAVTASDLEPWLLEGCRHAVFVDGRFRPELSALGEPGDDAGAMVGSLATALSGADQGLVSRHLGRHLGFDDHPFRALNTALFEDGALVRLRRARVASEVVPELAPKPLQLLFLATADATAARMNFPRTLIVAEPASQATIIETYATLGAGVTFTCPMTELVAGKGSVVRHYRVQAESTEALHLAAFASYFERDASYTGLVISHGGGLVRLDLHAILDGEGVDFRLDGLYVLGGRQLADHHLRVEHKQPHCGSHELFKGILDDQARGVFSGRIYVHRAAQKTDAVQTNRNLLLSPEALVNSNPQLEIFADDVKCTHGSTTGQIDADAVFYLRSRGLSADAARSLLTFAFAAELVERIAVPALRRQVEEVLYDRLPGGELVRAAQ